MKEPLTKQEKSGRKKYKEKIQLISVAVMLKNRDAEKNN